MLKNSRYNFQVPFEDDLLLYNANTGAVEKLDGSQRELLAAVLTGPIRTLPEGALPAELESRLKEGGFLTPSDRDEVAVVKDRFWHARRKTPIVLTITTTQDCNLGCYYCYEDRTKDKLAATDVDDILNWIRGRFDGSDKDSLHVDWYGGEPFLNQTFMSRASYAIQTLCTELGVAYHASAISNGTQWPEDPAAFVREHKIRQVQISFDGMRENHNKRRRYRKDYRPDENASSFDRAVAVVDSLLDAARVDVRFNIDRGNRSDLEPFIAMMRERGWFQRAYPAAFQPARLAAYSERSAFMRKTELSRDEYDTIRAWVRRELAGEAVLEESEIPKGFAYPKTSVCAALAQDSVVLGADRSLYRCGLQVGETHKAVGSLGVTEGNGDADWWGAFDPTELPTCSQCSFLPVCWGGCPEKHLAGDVHALREQSRYWRENLPRIVASTLKRQAPQGFVFDLDDQFRDGVPDAYHEAEAAAVWPLKV